MNRLLEFLLASAWLTQAAAASFSGTFVDGEGDEQMLDAINSAFESIHPTPRMACLPLLYKRDWNGLGESCWWPGWWSQNAFGAAYAMQPFMGEEPYASWMANAYDMHFRFMGDGKPSPIRHPGGAIPPDGALPDAARVFLAGGQPNGFGDFRNLGKAAEITGKALLEFGMFKQGDGRTQVADWCFGSTAASLIVECDRVLMRHDAKNSAERLAQFRRVAAFLDSRRDLETNLLKSGHNSNLLAPSFRGVKKPDGTFEFGYLTEISVLYAAGLDRLVEVCLLCGDAAGAKAYRATADKVRQGLRRLMEPEGYFIRSEESDGRHGVFGAAKHGYFEAHPNHDAGGLRVIGDPANARIVDFMLNKVKGPKAPGGLMPHDLVLPNYPGYDDHSGEGDMSYGTWCNGGVWPQHQGIMNIACFRAGEFRHPFAAWAAMRPLAEAFRNDSPLAGWGAVPWPGQRKRPYCFCFDAWGPAAGILRGLFEYGYEAGGLRLWPHLPPSISRYVQKVPAVFGKTRVFLASTGNGSVTSALVDGLPAKLDADGSLFIPMTGTKSTVTVEFLRGAARSRGVPTIPPPDQVPPRTDNEFWSAAPAEFVAARDFAEGMKRAGHEASFEAAQARVAIELLAAGHERRSLASAGKLKVPDLTSREIPPADEAKLDELYQNTACWILGGLQDHLRGVSYLKLPVAPETIRIARKTKLVQ